MRLQAVGWLVVVCAAAAGLPGCRNAPAATGPCDVVYRFDNVRRDTTGTVGTTTRDEWTDITRVLGRYTREVGQPRTSNFKKLPRGEVRTCEVTITVPSVGDLAKIEADLQSLAEQHSDEKRLDFNLDRVTMVYKSNYVAAGLEVTLRGVTQQGFKVAVYTEKRGTAIRTTAGRGGNWSVKLPSVPAGRVVYGYSQDPAGRVRTRYFCINVVTMQQEAVDKEEFEEEVGVDPDKEQAETQSKAKTSGRKTARGE